MSKNKKVVLGLSGGMDSATLCAYYLDKGYEVFPVSFNYGSKHNKYENYAARSLAVLWNLTIKEINLDFIGQLFKSNLLKTGEAIPEGYYTDQNMSQTVVPGRNVIFISIMMGYAWSIGADTIAIGAHAGDHCLAEGSLISTTSGLTPIECLKSGDEIYSYNVKNQCVEKDKVVLLIKKGIPEEILEFTLKSGEKILVTEGHKMYRLIHTNFDSNHGFTKEVCKTQAKDVKEKDTFLLLSSLGGIGLNQIKSIKKIKNEKPVYDIQIEKNHNFFAGSVGGILVSNSIYEDCRAGFIAAMNAAVIAGSGDRVSLEAPFQYLDKTEILSIGLSLKNPVPYQFTRTCYKDQELSCGRCGSDVERLMAFHDLKEIDPIEYEDRKYYLSMIK